MTAECRELEVALSLRAAGALDAAEAARLDAHLAECPACRAEAARTAELLDLARLPPPTLAEHRALSDLSVRVAAGMKPELAPEARSLRAGRRLAAGILVAAGVAAIAIAPIMVRRQRPPPAATAVTEATSADETPSAPTAAPAAEATAKAEEGWQEPDLDTLWQDASVVSAAWDGGSE